MRRAKTFHHLNSSYFESALIFCTVQIFSYLVYSQPESILHLFVSRLLSSRICSSSLRTSFTRIPHPASRIPHLLLISSYLIYPYPVFTLIPFASSLLVSRTCSYLFVSRLPVSRICSYSLRISFTLIPHLLLSFTLYKNPVKCLNRLSLLRL